jgi:hypothetical protein
MDLRHAETYSNRLIRFAFSDKSENSTRTQAFGHNLGQLVGQGWDSGEWYPPHYLKVAKIVACLPSLVAVSESRPQTQSIARQVSSNFQYLADHILYTPSLTPDSLSDMDEEHRTRRRTIGELSEIGVLGALWWSVANDLRDSETYPLPTTRAEDSGRIKKEGYNTGTDIIMRTSGSKEGQALQVKTKIGPDSIMKVRRYHPDIAVVALSNILISDTEYLSYRLLSILISDDSKQLTAINGRVDDAVEEARAKAVIHQNYTRRALTHNGGRGGNRTLTP